MNISDYFNEKTGTGVLATSDRSGRVDAAIYARPHLLDGGQLGFIMADRRTHRNVAENPRAVYLFHESGGGYRGVRLDLVKVREEEDPERIAALRRSAREYAADDRRFLVTFRIESSRPLVGDGEASSLEQEHQVGIEAERER